MTILVKTVIKYALAELSLPLEWPDNISDWRWVSPLNKMFQPNPNWFEQLPLNFAEAAKDKESEYREQIQEYLSCYLLGDSEEPNHLCYPTTVLFPLEYDDVS